MTTRPPNSRGLPKRRSPRLRNFNYPSTFAYSITICTSDRAPHFADADIGQEVAQCLEVQADACAYRLVAYCVMPDHVHILTAPSEEPGAVPLPRFIRQFKAGVTHRLAKRGLGPTIWQRSFYDHVLRKDEDLHRTANYILENPVRKGLVRSVDEYPLARFLGY